MKDYLEKLKQPGQTTATIEMNVRHLKPIKKGELIAEARLVKKGKKVITVSARVVEQDQNELAIAGASFIVSRLSD